MSKINNDILNLLFKNQEPTIDLLSRSEGLDTVILSKLHDNKIGNTPEIAKQTFNIIDSLPEQEKNIIYYLLILHRTNEIFETINSKKEKKNIITLE